MNVPVDPQVLPELDITALNPPLNRILIDSVDQFTLIEDFLSRSKTIGWDLETNVTDNVFERKIRTITIGDRNEQYVIDMLAFAGTTEALMEQGNYRCPEWAKPVYDLMVKVLDSREYLKVGVHVQFDYEVTRWCLGIRTWNFFDCFLAEKVIYCGLIPFYKKDFWGLDDMVRRYMQRGLRKDLQTSFDLESPLTPEQLDYCALDVRLPLRIREVQLKTLERDGLVFTASVENTSMPAFGEMYLNGFYMDADEWLEVEQTNKEKHAKNVELLDTYFIPVCGSKHSLLSDLDAVAQCAEEKWRAERDKELRAAYRKEFYAARKQAAKIRKEWDKYEGEAAINYASSSQLLEKLQGMGFDDIKDTSDGTLAKLAPWNDVKKKYDGKQVIAAIREYRETQKALGTYGESFLKYINPTTRRIHSKIDQLGAETGRTSSAKPNIQNIPKGSAYRSCFKARPGKILIIVDMSGAELRIIADLSAYEVWIEAFKNGWDVHSLGAALMRPEEWAAGTEPDCEFEKSRRKCKCKVHNEIRDDNKAVNFGVAYGMEAKGLAGKIGKPLKTAKDLLAKWRQVNAKIQKFLTSIADHAVKNMEARTSIGRRRLFTRPQWEVAKQKALERHEELVKDGLKNGPFTHDDISREYKMMFAAIEREGKNTPIQGGNADIMKIAISAGFDPDGKPFMWHLLPEYGAELVNCVHDEAVVECDIDRAEDCLKMIGDCINRAGKMCLKYVEMEWEGKINQRWLKK